MRNKGGNAKGKGCLARYQKVVFYRSKHVIVSCKTLKEARALHRC